MRNFYRILFISLVVTGIFSTTAFSQGVAINTSGNPADASAMLDVQSTSGGMLIPRLSFVQRGNLVAPANGLLIYQTDNQPGFYFFNGTVWTKISTGLDVTGTQNYVSKFTGANSLGNSQIFDNGTNVGIGTTSPSYKLHVTGTGYFTNGTTAAVIADAGNNRGLYGSGTYGVYGSGNYGLYGSGGAYGVYGDGGSYGVYGTGGIYGVYGVSAGGWAGYFNGLFYISGNTGIGVSSPTAQLHTTGTVRFANYTNGFLRVDANGNLGVSAASSLFTAGNGLSWAGSTLNSVWSVSGNNIYNNNTANVGIGTSSPSFPLHVNGAAAVSILYDQSNTSFFIDPASTSVTNDMRANIFYDYGNTSFYVDPASNSTLYNLTIGTDITTTSDQGVFWSAGNTSYGIFREAGAWTSPYPDLRISFFTGIKMGANYQYGGIRFYNSSDMLTQIFSVGDGDNYVRAYYGIFSPVLYDMNNTSYYIDPASVSVTNDFRANIFYDAGNTSFYLQPRSVSILYDVRASIFYDRDNTGYYIDPASTSSMYNLYTYGVNRFSALSGTGTRIVMADASGVLSASTAAGAGLVSGSGVATAVAFWNGANSLSYNANLFWDNTNARLGIGTTTPSFNLHVSGSAAASIYYDLNNTGYYIDPASTSITNDFRANIFYDAGNTSYYIDPAASSVIGTLYASIIYDRDNSSYYLDPAANSTINGLFTYGTNRFSALAGTGTRIVVADLNGTLSTSTAAGFGLISGTGTTNYVPKWTGTNTQGLSQIFDNGTYVGIGTTSPSATLHIINPSATAGALETVLGRAIGDVNFWIVNKKGVTTNNSGDITSKFGLAYSGTTDNAFIRFHRGSSSTGGFISISTNNDTERLRIDASGNVGIGTSTPTSKLEVVGSLSADLFYDRNNTSYYCDPASTSITNDFRANIFYDAINTGFYLQPRSVSILNDVRASIFYDRDNTGYYVDPASTSNLATLYTTGTNRFSALAGTGTRIVVADATGILSTSTAAGFGLISGTGTTNYVTKWTGANTQGNSQIFDNGTNVGIGTASPGWKLDVVGNARIGANTGQNNIAALAVSAGQGAASTFRDIDMHGSWSAGEGHAITASHSTGSTNIVGQIVFQHDSPGSRIRFGRLYHSGDQSTYPMELVSNGANGILRLNTDSYTLYGPNSSWSAYLQVGGNGRVTTYASVAATNGNLHIDAADGGYATYINYYSQNNTYINAQAGNVGIGTTSPSFKLHVPSGYIGTDYINTTDNVVGSGVTGIMVKAGDNYHRTANASAIASYLNTTGTWIPNNGSGDYQIASSSTGTNYYEASLELRESNFIGASGVPPRISFHWGGVVASQIGIESSGRIAILNNPGTTYENLIANNIYTNGNMYIGSYGGINSVPTTYGSIGLLQTKGGYYGVLFGQSTSNPNLMYDGSGNGGIYYENYGWLYYTTSSNKFTGFGTTAPSAKIHVVGTTYDYLDANHYSYMGYNTNWTNYAYQANPSGSAAGNYWAEYGYHTCSYDGTDYSSGMQGGLKGYCYWGRLYTAGVQGWNYGDYNRSSGVHGFNNSGSAWGALGYKNSGGTSYGGYFTSYTSGTGYLPDTEITSAGMGSYGGTIGSWSRGEIMGMATSGELFALYNDGNAYTEGYSADIVETGAGRKAAFAVTSTEIKIYADGKGNISGNEVYVKFDADFASMLSTENLPNVTITPIGGWAPVYIKTITPEGFIVAVADNNNTGLDFTWIAVGKRIDGTNAALPADLANDRFNQNIKGFMFNENDTQNSATPMWWDGSQIRFDKLPEKPIDMGKKMEEEKRHQPVIPHN